jgi:hypothetical protein
MSLQWVFMALGGDAVALQDTIRVLYTMMISVEDI